MGIILTIWIFGAERVFKNWQLVRSWSRALAIDDLLTQYDLQEILALARGVLPKLFRSG